MSIIAVTNVCYVDNGIHKKLFYQKVDDHWGVQSSQWVIPLSEPIDQLKKEYKWQDKSLYPTYESFLDAMSQSGGIEEMVGKKLTGDCVIKDMPAWDWLRKRKNES